MQEQEFEKCGAMNEREKSAGNSTGKPRCPKSTRLGFLEQEERNDSFALFYQKSWNSGSWETERHNEMEIAHLARNDEYSRV